METGREDRLRLLLTAALVVLAAVGVASWGASAPAPAPEEAGELAIVRSSEVLVDAGRPFAVAGGRLVSLACDERCRLLVGGPTPQVIELPPGPVEWRDELGPVASPDGRRLAFTLIQDDVPRTAVVDLEAGTLLVRSTSLLDEARLHELRWGEGGRAVIIPRLIGGDLSWRVGAPAAPTESG